MIIIPSLSRENRTWLTTPYTQNLPQRVTQIDGVNTTVVELAGESAGKVLTVTPVIATNGSRGDAPLVKKGGVSSTKV